MIIGVSGKARSGKGEFAKIAVTEFGAEQVSFAGPLKAEVAAFLDACLVVWEARHLCGEQHDKEEILNICVNNIPVKQDWSDYIVSFLEKYATPKPHLHYRWWSFTPRALMQWWGTEFRRSHFGDDYWVNKALDQCSDLQKLYVIDDCRFPNEAEGIRATGGKLVRVVRPGGPLPSNPKHPSEIALDLWNEWDAILVNHGRGGLEGYHEACRSLLKELLR